MADTTAYNALYEVITPMVDETTKVQIWRDVAAQMGEENERRLKELFPKLLVAPGIDGGEQARLKNYMEKIDFAYTEQPSIDPETGKETPFPPGYVPYYDAQGSNDELYALLDLDYLKAIKLGLLPPPLSRPWSVIIKIPWLFENRQRDLHNLYRRFVRAMDTNPDPHPSPVMSSEEY